MNEITNASYVQYYYNWLAWFKHVAVLQNNCGVFKVHFTTQNFVYHNDAIYVIKVTDYKTDLQKYALLNENNKITLTTK